MSDTKKIVHSLTSLRYILAMIVAISHVPLVIPEYDIPHFLNHNAVVVFFIFSGFILTYIYGDDNFNEHEAIKNFYLSRAARIYPLNFLLLVMLIPAIYLLTVSVEINHSSALIGDHILIHTTWQSFLLQLLGIQSLTAGWSAYHDGWNNPMWSISVIIFFYMVFPHIIRVIRYQQAKKSTLFQIFIFLLLFVMLRQSLTVTGNVIAFTSVQDFLYYNPIMRLPDFLLGMFLYFLSTKLRIRPINLLGPSGFLLCIGLLESDYSALLWPLFGVLTIYMLYQVDPPVLHYRWLLALGESSYAIIVSHYLVFIFYRALIDFGFLSPSIFVFLSILLFSTLFALLLYEWFERPAFFYLKKLWQVLHKS